MRRNRPFHPGGSRSRFGREPETKNSRSPASGYFLTQAVSVAVAMPLVLAKQSNADVEWAARRHAPARTSACRLVELRALI